MEAGRACMRESSLTASESRPEPRPLFRPWFLMCVLVTAAMIGWAVWPSAPEVSALERSRADGKPRFYATTYPKLQLPPHFTLLQRLRWEWAQFNDHAERRNFLDTLLLIHERPGLVKVVPRSKLAEYEKAGLVKAASC